MTDIPLIRHVAKMDKPMIISTGLANMDEVEIAVNTCLDEGNKKIILLHCIAHIQQDQMKLIILLWKQ